MAKNEAIDRMKHSDLKLDSYGYSEGKQYTGDYDWVTKTSRKNQRKVSKKR